MEGGPRERLRQRCVEIEFGVAVRRPWLCLRQESHRTVRMSHRRDRLLTSHRDRHRLESSAGLKGEASGREVGFGQGHPERAGDRVIAT